MKKGYTKYDYIDIYSKLGVMTGTFAAVSISLSLFLGFVITLAAHAHPDLSSRICLLLVCSESACRASQYQAL